jgi:carbon-monoxide dehydrogenase medium subunit
MIPQSFEYFRPQSISEAIALLQEHGEGAKILSGGQSLIPMMKIRLARPECIINICFPGHIAHWRRRRLAS